MRSRLLWRRSSTAAGVYVGSALGILSTIVAARVLGLEDFGLFATVMATGVFFQVFLDLTVEESLTKYGFRYVQTEEWGKLRRLFRGALVLKVAGGVVAAVVLGLIAPFADDLFGTSGLTAPMLAVAVLPLVQAPENVAATSLLLRGRYDLRAGLLAVSMGLKLVAIAIAAPHGVTATVIAVVLAQIVASAVISVIGAAALRRFPDVPPEPLADDRGEVLRFVAKSSVATGMVSLRTTLIPVLLGVVSSPTQVGLLRVAQAPQTGFAVASSPARLILLTEQTRDWERGERRRVLAGVKSYMAWAGLIVVVAIPVGWVLMPWLVEVVFGPDYGEAVAAARIVLLAGAIQLVLGWSKSLPTTIGRPGLRIVSHGLETLVVVPLVVVLGAEWGATGAAVAILVSTVVFAAAWLVILLRLRNEVARSGPTTTPTEALAP